MTRCVARSFTLQLQLGRYMRTAHLGYTNEVNESGKEIYCSKEDEAKYFEMGISGIILRVA
ncbi:MAG: hypothetical protein JWQ09_1652 [Segetibacter sp.]|nr:hypothetical protein [Segetibacter sp.]